MPDETTSNQPPVDTAIPQAQETLNPTPSDAVIAPAPVEAPTELVQTPEPIPEEPTAQMGGNEPFAPASAVETPVETPVVTPEPAPVETSVPTPVPEPVTQAPTPTPAQVVVDSNSPRLGASGEASATRIEASPQAPLAENINSQTFIKSIRELFTKAQLAIQNRKRKKIDRILTLFAKQTMITNNEVEKLLHVSDATATRYLSTLEKEGKLKQNKKTGKGVSYSKI